MRSSGFDVHYILETHQGAEDEKVLQIANDEIRILITQDKDFGELVYHLQKAHFGIVLIRLGNHDAIEKSKLVALVMLEYREKLMNAFTVIQPQTIRIRK